MANEELIDMEDDSTKFCVSWFVSRVADTGIKQVIDGWNNHPIPGTQIFPKIVINTIYIFGGKFDQCACSMKLI